MTDDADRINKSELIDLIGRDLEAVQRAELDALGAPPTAPPPSLVESAEKLVEEALEGLKDKANELEKQASKTGDELREAAQGDSGALEELEFEAEMAIQEVP